MRTTIVKWMKILVYCSFIIYFFYCNKNPVPEGGSGGSGSYTIDSVAFGESADSNGGIQNPDSVFLSDETEVYYLIILNRSFSRRSKVLKIWEKENGNQWNTLFTAIQIVEENDQRIFGVFRKHDMTAIGSGNYQIRLQFWDSSNKTYTDIGTTPNFTIENIP